MKILSRPMLVKMLKVILRIFSYLLDKNFGRSHKYHKILNHNNVKISDSCINNIKNIISSYNKEITNFYHKLNGKTCNFGDKSNRPLENKY